jgi:hypothetical protein
VPAATKATLTPNSARYISKERRSTRASQRVAPGPIGAMGGKVVGQFEITPFLTLRT